MTTKSLAGILLAFLFLSSSVTDEYPSAEITNGLIRARLYLPDRDGGFYRGSRFDWAGVMPELEYQGHTYFGKWYSDVHNPVFHDHIAGPVEEFTPVGYDEAKPTEPFLKIGVGILVKEDEEQYKFAKPFKNINSGTWKVNKKKDQVEFMQTLVYQGYSYQYSKTVQLLKDKPEMVLSHSLKNDGTKTIVTSVYNHNFFVFDDQPVGPDFDVTFPFTLISETTAAGPLGKLQDNKILFTKELGNSDHLFYKSLTGFGNNAADYDIKIENHKTGGAVRITCNQPLSKVVFWSAHKTLCPEPYVKLEVKPGETVNWKITYKFYSHPEIK